MESDRKYNLSFVSFLFAPILIAVAEFELGPVLSCILILITLAIAIKYEGYFSKRFGVINLRLKYILISVLSLGYVFIANYLEAYRISYLIAFPVISYILLYNDLSRMDREYTGKLNK
jgi:hypothetical protein